MRTRRTIGALAAAVLAVCVVAGDVAADTGVPRVVDERGVPRDTAVVPVSSTVTLLTGERVRLDVSPTGAQTVDVLSGPNGTDAPDTSTFTQFSWHGDAYVVPDRVLPYLGETVDPRLFDVSYLVRAELDDARRGSLPVSVEESTRGAAAKLPGATVERTSGRTARARLAKKHAGDLGALLADRWSSRRLDGIERIALAAPAGTPAPPSPFAPRTAVKGPAYRTLTVRAVDRDGDPGAALGLVQNLDDARLTYLTLVFTGEKSISVPEGRYSVGFSVLTELPGGGGFETSLTTKPQVQVVGDTTVVLDARAAVPYRAQVDPAVDDDYRQDVLSFTRRGTDGRGGPLGQLTLGLRLIAVTPNPAPEVLPARLLATPTTRVTGGEFGFDAYTQLTDRASNGEQTDDPSYFLHFPTPGRIPSSLTYQVPAADLTTVRARLYDSASGTCNRRNLTTYVRTAGGEQSSMGLAIPSAGDRTDYWYSARPALSSWKRVYVGNDCAIRYGEPVTARHGGRVSETWSKGLQVPAVAAPAVSELRPMPFPPPPDTTLCPACRQDDVGMIYLMHGADSELTHHAAQQLSKKRHTTLRFYRNGQLALDGASLPPTGTLHPTFVALPLLPDPATYRLDWRYAVDSHPEEPTVSTSWTFRSARGDAKASFPDQHMCGSDDSRGCSLLPLLFPVYDLALDHGSRARAGGPFDIEFSVHGQRYAPMPDGVRATVEVSYDGGETWRPAQSAKSKGAPGGNAFAVTVQHPPLAQTDGFVAVRVHAEDRAGNAVDQTVLRAYGLSE